MRQKKRDPFLTRVVHVSIVAGEDDESSKASRNWFGMKKGNGKEKELVA